MLKLSVFRGNLTHCVAARCKKMPSKAWLVSENLESYRASLNGVSWIVTNGNGPLSRREP